MKISPIGPGAVAYYFQGQGDGEWLGKGAGQLGLVGNVDRSDLAAVLRGCHPVQRAFLPMHRPVRRRAGWDLILAAPKSVSLLAEARGVVVGAHRAAVAGVVDHFEAELLHVRRAGASVPGCGVVAASFAHHRNASGEPHLHTHLVLANLAPGPDGAWSHVNNTWWSSRQTLGAVYQLGLRHHLQQAGLDLGWRLRDDGLGDVAGVPRTAIAQASSRGRAAAALGATSGARSGRSRAHAVIASRTTTPRAPAPSIPQDLGGPPGPDARRDLEAAVTARLATERSQFRRSDVFVALAATADRGLAPADAARWVDRFCSRAIDVSCGLPRWTTPLARAADDRFVGTARQQPPVTILSSPPGRSNLLAHAAYLDGATSGSAIRLVSEHADRWRALADLPDDGGRPDVVVVDQADRRATPELLALQAGAARAGAHLILVEGGSAGRLSWVRSDALVRLADEIGRVDPGPPPAWEPGRGPAGQLLEAWIAMPDSVLVGLGPAEVDGLNQAARRHLVETGAVGGPAVEHQGRWLQAGDRVVTLRRLGPDLPPGRLRHVVTVDPATGGVLLTGDGRNNRVDRAAAAHLGYGYAVTPSLAATTDRALLVLGRADALGIHRGRVLLSTRDGPKPQRSIQRGLE